MDRLINHFIGFFEYMGWFKDLIIVLVCCFVSYWSEHTDLFKRPGKDVLNGK